MVTNPRASSLNRACREWLESLLEDNTRVVIAEIVDYEVRGELLRANKAEGLRRLDLLGADLWYEPLTTAAMRRAALFWADARRRGMKTADDRRLDIDLILAAQAILVLEPGDDLIIAMTNVRHLALFAPAAEWPRIA